MEPTLDRPVATATDPAGPEPAADAVASVRGLRLSLARGASRSEVLRGIDLDVVRGEILAVVGESGSGKSVMSLTLMGLLPERSRPQVSGSAVVAGVDMTSAATEEQRKVRRHSLGVVFQDPMSSLNPTTRVGKQITEAAGSADESLRLMRAVGIPQPEQRFSAYPHELSGGLRQRVMIAMAIAGNPQLIIADEPTTALDVTVQAQVLGVLRDLRQDLGCSILMITHDLGVAAQVADRIVVMQQGEIVEEGPALELLERPQHPYTKRLLRARLDLDTDRSRVLPTGDEEAYDAGPATELAEPSKPAVPVEPAGASRPARGRLVEITEVHCDFKVRDAGGRRAMLHALRGVTTDIGEGESLALVGESGSGKSTLLRAIAGLETRWNGRIDKPGPDDIQMVFQDAGSSLTPWLSVEELLMERLRRSPLRRAGRRQRIAETLELMGLPLSTLAARPGELSGGQRQRVALARATIVPPKVLLCDEPTSALDVSLAAVVLNLIQRLRRELGMTVVFVTHDLGVARFVSDRVAVMYLGRLVETGPVEEVIGNPRHPYTRALVAAVPGAGKELPVIVGEPASAIAPPSGCAFHPRCPVATEECATTLQGTQLVALGIPGSGPPEPGMPSGRHEVACLHRQELAP